MRVVVADTSPLSYLVLIDAIDVLPELYGRIHVPREVTIELDAPGTPERVAEWIRRQPDWLQIEIVAPSSEHTSLTQLDPGERVHSTGLTDEERAPGNRRLRRREAAARSIQTIGTLGVLRQAAIRGLLDLRSTVSRLQSTNFRMSKVLVESLLAEDQERRLARGR